VAHQRESLPAAVPRRRCLLQKVPIIVVWPIDWRETRFLFAYVHAIKSAVGPFSAGGLSTLRLFCARSISFKSLQKALCAIKIKEDLLGEQRLSTRSVYKKQQQREERKSV